MLFTAWLNILINEKTNEKKLEGVERSTKDAEEV